MGRFVEACDWIVWQLGGSYVRSASAAGYKGCVQDGAGPSRAFLAALDPSFAGFVDDKVDGPAGRLSTPAGGLSPAGARLTGLREGTTVAVGNIDAHATAPAAGAVEAGQLVAIMGTSTVLLVNATELREVEGMSGAVHEGVAPGLWGYEAGQSGVGDIFGWFVRSCMPGEVERAAAARGVSVHELLAERAADQAVGEHGLVALDWLSGNRSVLVDHDLSGLVLGLTLGTTAEDVYRALLEATAFGLRRVIEAFTDAGLPVRELVVTGGLVRNRLLMQICADVTRLPLATLRSSQGPASGAAIHAAVAAGCHPDLAAASATMAGARSASHAGRRGRAAVRRALPGVPRPARPLRSWWQRRDAPAQEDAPGGGCPPAAGGDGRGNGVSDHDRAGTAEELGRLPDGRVVSRHIWGCRAAFSCGCSTWAPSCRSSGSPMRPGAPSTWCWGARTSPGTWLPRTTSTARSWAGSPTGSPAVASTWTGRRTSSRSTTGRTRCTGRGRVQPAALAPRRRHLQPDRPLVGQPRRRPGVPRQPARRRPLRGDPRGGPDPLHRAHRRADRRQPHPAHALQPRRRGGAARSRGTCSRSRPVATHRSTRT